VFETTRLANPNFGAAYTSVFAAGHACRYRGTASASRVVSVGKLYAPGQIVHQRASAAQRELFCAAVTASRVPGEHREPVSVAAKVSTLKLPLLSPLLAAGRGAESWTQFTVKGTLLKSVPAGITA
jgi:hypothetical protein